MQTEQEGCRVRWQAWRIMAHRKLCSPLKGAWVSPTSAKSKRKQEKRKEELEKKEGGEEGRRRVRDGTGEKAGRKRELWFMTLLAPT